MSGESFSFMADFTSSKRTSVASGSSSSASAAFSSSVPQPSSKASRSSFEKRCASRVAAPRPLMAWMGMWAADGMARLLRDLDTV